MARAPSLDPFAVVTDPGFPDPATPEPRLRRAGGGEPDGDLPAVARGVAAWLARRLAEAPGDGYRFTEVEALPAALVTALVAYRRALFLYGLPLLYGMAFTAGLTRTLFGQDLRLGVGGAQQRVRRILVSGERGSGKERVAEVIGHTLSLLSQRPGAFARYNAAAFHPNTLMSTLFGHVKGAFTGAHHDRGGVFEKLDGGGAVLLDEIGDISPELQAALLRILETGEFHRLGAEERTPLTATFHLVAATNYPWDELSTGKRLRADLVDRLADQVVRVPPLREVLAAHRYPEALFTHLISLTYEELGIGWRVADTLVDTSAIVKRLAALRYGWPGNLREAAAALRAAVWQGEDGLAEVEARAARRLLRSDEPQTPPTAPIAWGRPGALERALDEQLRGHYVAACRGATNINDLARRLGVSRQRAARDLRRFGLRPLG